MRACLFALLLLFCLPLPWSSAAAGTATPCGLEHGQPAHFMLPPSCATAPETADHAQEAHAQHPHCSSCHSGAQALLGTDLFIPHATSTRAESKLHAGTQVLLAHRPERPQWTPLAGPGR